MRCPSDILHERTESENTHLGNPTRFIHQWQRCNAAGYAFYLILALLLLDLFLLPGIVKRANAALPAHEEMTEAEKALRAAEAEEGPKHDRDYAENWIDRLSLF